MKLTFLRHVKQMESRIARSCLGQAWWQFKEDVLLCSEMSGWSLDGQVRLGEQQYRAGLSLHPAGRWLFKQTERELQSAPVVRRKLYRGGYAACQYLGSLEQKRPSRLETDIMDDDAKPPASLHLLYLLGWITRAATTVWGFSVWRSFAAVNTGATEN